MQRWFTTFLGLAVVVLALGIVVHGFRPPKAIGHDPFARDAGADADRPKVLADGGLAIDSTEASVHPIDGLDSSAADFRLPDGAALWPLAEGTPVPSLPMSAPRQVRFGVALISYAGAQPSPTGAKNPTRSKSEARALAEKLLVTAQDDFHAAVQQGDQGSSDDVGRVRAGVLEPASEYVLFTLSVNQVGGPIETPRGYWIVKRLE